MILLFMAVLTHGNFVRTGVTREKQSRVAELLLGRMRPRELLAGKVLGIGALGLGQFALIIATVAISLKAIDAADTPHVPTTVSVWLVSGFILGYAFYSVAYAALGAFAGRVEDAGSAAAPATVNMALGFLAGIAVQNPESSPTTLLSFLPPTAPIVMPVRLTLTNLAVWQVLVAALLTAASVRLLLRLAGRIYTGAVLRTGTKIPPGGQTLGGITAAMTAWPSRSGGPFALTPH